MDCRRGSRDTARARRFRGSDTRGWEKRRALLFNLVSASTFLFGRLVAHLASHSFDVTFLVPFAAGNFVYIAASDLVPEVNKHEGLRENAKAFGSFVFGLAVLLAIRLLMRGHGH